MTARMDFDSGNTTERSIFMGVAPSIMAASSSSYGIEVEK